MELWIRTQDKGNLTKIDNVRIKHEYEQKKVNDNYGRVSAYINGKYRCSYIYADSTWLGEYTSKERALEVLDEIEAVLLYEQLEKVTGKTFIKVKDGVAIYEMPEK